MKRRMMLVLVILTCFTCLFVAAQDYYQCWTDGGGTVNGQNLGNGHYKVTWSNCGNFVCGSGWNSYSGSVSWTGSASGAQYFGVYGWTTNPLVEYYIGRGGGSSKGTYSTSKGSYTLNIDNRNGPNIQGNGPFMQYNCSGSGSSGINMAEHFTGWRQVGAQVGSPNYCIVATEGWGGSSGSADVTVSSGGGGSTTTTTSSGGSTPTPTNPPGSTTTTSSGGGGGCGTCNWYGTNYPMCCNTSSGWGWENNKSCISQSTCDSQGGGSATPSPTNPPGSTTTTSTSGGGAINCSSLSEWNSSTIYNDGDRVKYSGKAYEANWYSQGQNPASNSGQWMVWTLLGSC